MIPNLRKNKDKIEGSPLLGKAGATPIQDSPANATSTIHADRFDMARFSERKEEDESSMRIIIYVIVVVAIGIGLALLVRQLITTQSDSDSDPVAEPADEAEVEDSSVLINTNVQPDPSDAPTNEQLLDSTTISLGNADASADGVTMSSLSYNKHETFSRLFFGISGVDDVTNLPRIVFNYDSSRNSIDVVLPVGIQINEELKNTIQVGDLVSNIVYSETSNKFTLNVSGEFMYNVVPTISGLTIDIRTTAQIDELDSEGDEEEPVAEETPEEEPVEETPEAPTPSPEGMNKDNDFSQNKQFINAGVTGNTISYSAIPFEDYGPHFEVGWSKPYQLGDQFIPYASAELVDQSGAPFIKVVIENLDRITFEQNVTSSYFPINMEGANFMSMEVESFENGVATIMIGLKRKADFRLYSTTTESGLSQILAVQIKD